MRKSTRIKKQANLLKVDEVSNDEQTLQSSAPKNKRPGKKCTISVPESNLRTKVDEVSNDEQTLHSSAPENKRPKKKCTISVSESNLLTKVDEVSNDEQTLHSSAPENKRTKKKCTISVPESNLLTKVDEISNDEQTLQSSAPENKRPKRKCTISVPESNPLTKVDVSGAKNGSDLLGEPKDKQHSKKTLIRKKDSLQLRKKLKESHAKAKITSKNQNKTESSEFSNRPQWKKTRRKSVIHDDKFVGCNLKLGTSLTSRTINNDVKNLGISNISKGKMKSKKTVVLEAGLHSTNGQGDKVSVNTRTELTPRTEEDVKPSDVTICVGQDSNGESDEDVESDWEDVDEKTDKDEELAGPVSSTISVESEGLSQQISLAVPSISNVESEMSGAISLAAPSVSHNDVRALLMHMEGNSTSQTHTKASDEESRGVSHVAPGFSSDDESDWEEVADHPCSPIKSQLPTQPVQITLDAPDLFKKKKRNRFDWQTYFQRQLNKFQRGLQLDIHKVHMLCLLANGIQKNRLCSEPSLLCQGLSVVSHDLLPKRKNSVNFATLEKLVKWLSETFVIDTGLENRHNNMAESLENGISSRRVASTLQLVMVFVIVFRSLGLDVRLMMSCQPIPIKRAMKGSLPAKRKHASSDKSGKSSQSVSPKCDPKPAESEKTSQSPSAAKQMKMNIEHELTENSTLNKNHGGEKKNSRKSRLDANNTTVKKMKDEKDSLKQEPDDSSNSLLKSETIEKTHRLKRRQRSTAKDTIAKNRKIFENVHNDSDGSSASSCPVLQKKRRKSVKREKKDSGSSVDEKNSTVDYRSSGSDFEVEIAKHKSRRPLRCYREKSKESSPESKEGANIQINKVKTENSTEKDKMEISSEKVTTENLTKEASEKISKNKKGVDEWMEVFLKSEDKWICVNCVKGTFEKPEELSADATQPLQYILAYHNDGSIKDLTAKYSPHWYTKTRKLQASPEWWQETLCPYKGKTVKREKKEDADVQAELLDRPFPTSIGDFKGHPLYILARHLLKFEAIYPDTAIPLGYIRNEPIYARELVHTLHSRENWFKEALSVKLGEQPYKMVKSRPKRGQKKENPDILDLALFGRWQTEPYVSPPAVDGKVPKNEFGAVALFQPSMLPAGTVLMTENGLNRIARKLNIDSAPAHTGWDFHGSFSHPVYEGIVVCQEFEEILRNAWVEEQENQRKRETERREKRVYGNWKLLIKSLLIKEKLKRRFNLEEPCEEKRAKITDKKSTKKKTKSRTDFNHLQIL